MTSGGPLAEVLNDLRVRLGATKIVVEWRTDHPAEPGDMRLEQQERDWERDEAEQPDEAFGADPGWVDA